MQRAAGRVGGRGRFPYLWLSGVPQPPKRHVTESMKIEDLGELGAADGRPAECFA
jgi:hypothetical protein